MKKMAYYKIDASTKLSKFVFWHMEAFIKGLITKKFHRLGFRQLGQWRDFYK